MGWLGKKPPKEEPIYKTSYGGFWIRVYPSRVEFKAGAGSENIPINQIASIHMGMVGLMQVIIETTGGKKYKVPTRKKKEVKDAIYASQSALNSGQTGQAVSDNRNIADEIKKLAELRDSGALSEEEFQAQKKKLLS
jgi:hypothetical protein